MPSLKTFRLRIRSVQSTQKITKAMKMVAAAKLRRAQDRVISARPYASLLKEMLANVVAALQSTEEGAASPLMVVRPVPAAGLTVVGSRSHGDAAALEAFLEGHRVAALSSAGSSLKFCLLARGEADLYPRLGRTMIWDTAAGQAVLTAAGGAVRRLDGTPLDCAGAALDNPHFVAQGAREAWAPR